MSKKKQDRRIAEIMHGFDFERVHQVMVFLDWKWATSPAKDSVPTLRQVQDCAQRCLEDVCSKPYPNLCGVGGFTAELDAMGVLELRFELEESISLPKGFQY